LPRTGLPHSTLLGLEAEIQGFGAALEIPMVESGSGNDAGGGGGGGGGGGEPAQA